MIKVFIEQKKIIITGHANYNNYGNDIVCASVSSIVYTTINGILNIRKDTINYSDDKDFKIEILSNDDITMKLINNMIMLLKDLEKQYPKNIIVKES